MNLASTKTTKTHRISKVEPKPASGPGALAGHVARCTCGWMGSTSLSAEWLQRNDVMDHADWHTKRGDKVTQEEV